MAELPLTLDEAALDTPQRDRARERLYVFLQLTCWGGLAVVQIVFSQFLPLNGEARSRMIPSTLQVCTLGLLVSHYGRWIIKRRGWKSLGWRALAPRVLGLACLQGLVWSTTLILIRAVLLKWEEGASHTVVFFGAWLQGASTLVGWLALYFFYHLFDRYNRLEIDRFRLVASVRQAELRALKSQLNPHFIFNSLNSLRALIEENPQRARQAVTQLANLLRYSLKSGQLETVPFEEELKVVRDYLSLEQVRHEERLRFRLDVSDEALQWQVPPMLLQTLVENAVKYGISSRTEGGEIGIVAQASDETLTLRVTNPGRLAPPVDKRVSTGLGLANAAERLRLLLGEKSSLQLRADGPDLVVAEAIIPRLSATRP